MGYHWSQTGSLTAAITGDESACRFSKLFKGSRRPDGKLTALQKKVTLLLLCHIGTANLQYSGQQEIAHGHASHIDCCLQTNSGLEWGASRGLKVGPQSGSCWRRATASNSSSMTSLGYKGRARTTCIVDNPNRLLRLMTRYDYSLANEYTTAAVVMP